MSESIDHMAMGKWNRSNLAGKQVVAAPTWLSNRDRPPLTPRAAERAARRMLKQAMGNVEDWQTTEINLKKPFEGELAGEYWVYMVTFRRPPTSRTEKTSVASIYVLMNGEALPLQIDP